MATFQLPLRMMAATLPGYFDSVSPIPLIQYFLDNQMRSVALVHPCGTIEIFGVIPCSYKDQ